ncbi:MAG: alkyl hydroperoxide reductase subunit C [Treponemataceae bacterium]
MSMIGKEIVDFTLDSFHAGKFNKVKKSDLLGKWSVLFFYPADFTFVCPTELEDLADTYLEFQKASCEIYSVSVDSHFVHKAWADASETIKKIKFPMLSDQRHILCKDLDVLIEEDGRSERATFILNPEGKIVAYEVVAGNIGRNAAELLRRLEALQFVAKHGDEVCPARWSPGKKTLKPGIDLVGKI